jgi:hypothetical protein
MHTTHRLPTVVPPTNKEKTAVPTPPQILQTASPLLAGVAGALLGRVLQQKNPHDDWLHD